MIPLYDRPLYLDTPKGLGIVLFVDNGSVFEHIKWTVGILETGEIWTFENYYVRLERNFTLGIRNEKTKKKVSKKKTPNETFFET